MQHYKEKGHRMIRKQLNELDSLLHLRRKFEINPDRIAVLNAEITETLTKIRPDRIVRKESFERVKDTLLQFIPGCSSEFYGKKVKICEILIN